MNTRATRRRRRRRILDKRPKELEQQADRNRGTSETTYMAFFWVSGRFPPRVGRSPPVAPGASWAAGKGGKKVKVALGHGEVFADPGGGRLPRHGGCGGGGDHHLRRGGEAPELAEVSPGRERPEGLGGGGGVGSGRGRSGVVVGGTEALAEDEGGGAGEEEVVGVGGGVGAEGGRGGGGEGGRGGAGAGGGDDGGLGLAEEPLDGLAVGLVAELAGELEDAGGADDGHADAAAAAVDLAVAVLGGRLANGEGGAIGVGGRDELLVRSAATATAAVWPGRHEERRGAERGGWGRGSGVVVWCVGDWLQCHWREEEETPMPNAMIEGGRRRRRERRRGWAAPAPATTRRRSGSSRCTATPDTRAGRHMGLL
ncbi:hypothetical protein OsJ_08973 [Oryza sativa Japonica Group]|uniref:Uncharacterized protein n=1 Tax=Oryza sativa subsp. japonica TaxID=39947 RepID=A3ACY4_ORYSJ|nr:hypothetical protein OsJ_08973 [Oryza sativa Japonica Group]